MPAKIEYSTRSCFETSVLKQASISGPVAGRGVLEQLEKILVTREGESLPFRFGVPEIRQQTAGSHAQTDIPAGDSLTLSQ